MQSIPLTDRVQKDILELLADGVRRSDQDIAVALNRPEPSIRRSRLILEREKRVRYAGARYEKTANVQTWRLP